MRSQVSTRLRRYFLKRCIVLNKFFRSQSASRVLSIRSGLVSPVLNSQCRSIRRQPPAQGWWLEVVRIVLFQNFSNGNFSVFWIKWPDTWSNLNINVTQGFQSLIIIMSSLWKRFAAESLPVAIHLQNIREDCWRIFRNRDITLLSSNRLLWWSVSFEWCLLSTSIWDRTKITNQLRLLRDSPPW